MLLRATPLPSNSVLFPSSSIPCTSTANQISLSPLFAVPFRSQYSALPFPSCSMPFHCQSRHCNPSLCQSIADPHNPVSSHSFAFLYASMLFRCVSFHFNSQICRSFAVPLAAFPKLFHAVPILCFSFQVKSSQIKSNHRFAIPLQRHSVLIPRNALICLSFASISCTKLFHSWFFSSHIIDVPFLCHSIHIAAPLFLCHSIAKSEEPSKISLSSFKGCHHFLSSLFETFLIQTARFFCCA